MSRQLKFKKSTLQVYNNSVKSTSGMPSSLPKKLRETKCTRTWYHAPESWQANISYQYFIVTNYTHNVILYWYVNKSSAL